MASSIKSTQLMIAVDSSIDRFDSVLARRIVAT
jgi:hypothetical protein